jgi:hypothetical protein
MAAKLTRLTHKIAIQLQLVAESFTICSSRSRRQVRKLLDTPLYAFPLDAHGSPFKLQSGLSSNGSNSLFRHLYRSPTWGSSVSIITRIRAGRPGSDSRQGQGRNVFSLPPRPHRLWGPPSLLSDGYRGIFPGGKAAEAWSWPLTT